MDKYQVRVALLKISLLTLAMTSWVFWSFVISTRPDQGEADPLQALVRLPASIPSQLPDQVQNVFKAEVKVFEPIEMETVQLPCWDAEDAGENEVSARWVRLTGKTCQTVSSAEAVSVRNVTTGYVATVFPTQKNRMTTDFIALQVGKNDLVIRLEKGDGAIVESRVSFYRE